MHTDVHAMACFVEHCALQSEVRGACCTIIKGDPAVVCGHMAEASMGNERRRRESGADHPAPSDEVYDANGDERYSVTRGVGSMWDETTKRTCRRSTGLVFLASPHLEDGVGEAIRAPFRNMFRLCQAAYRMSELAESRRRREVHAEGHT